MNKKSIIIAITAIFLLSFAIVLAKTNVSLFDDLSGGSITDNTSSLSAFNYCDTNIIASPSLIQKCCVNDDSQCFSACNTINDNDCVVKQKLEQMHQYLLANKSPLGYTPAPNESDLQPKTEVNRIIPGSQAIGYLNLYKATKRYIYLKEAQDRLDYIANVITTRPNDVWRNDSFDGFLGYAFLLGYESSGKQTYKDIGMSIANRCLGYHDLLNWGMMCAMNLGEAYKLTGNQAYLNEARAIVQRTSFFQNDDGSFPHQMADKNEKRNRGYTSWLGFELATYERYDSNLGSLIDLNKGANLLEILTNENGTPIYEYCPFENPIACTGCIGTPTFCEDRRRNQFECDIIGSGCWWNQDPGEYGYFCFCCGTAKACSTFNESQNCILNGCAWNNGFFRYYDEGKPDYETRGGIGELVSGAVVFNKTGRMNTKGKALNLLFSLQNPDYSFKPKWGYPSPPSQTSLWETPVVTTSDIFFQLSELLR